VIDATTAEQRWRQLGDRRCRRRSLPPVCARGGAFAPGGLAFVAGHGPARADSSVQVTGRAVVLGCGRTGPGRT
jgi:hypothetical protein